MKDAGINIVRAFCGYPFVDAEKTTLSESYADFKEVTKLWLMWFFALALNSIKSAETQGQYSVPEKNHQLHDPGKVRESCSKQPVFDFRKQVALAD